MSLISTIDAISQRTAISKCEFACENPASLFTSSELAFFWRDRGADEIWVTRGVAASFDSLDAAQDRIAGIVKTSSSCHLRAFGWLAFDPARTPSDIWSGTNSKCLVLPRAIGRWKNGTVSWNVIGDPLRESDFRAEPIPSPSLRQEPRSERNSFSSVRWRSSVERLHTQFLREQLDKAVLSERLSLAFTDEIPIALVLDRLLQRAPDSTVFACAVPGVGVFSGASPERLFRVRDRLVEVESLAGTRKRGRTVDEDDRLSYELEYSRKERREQSLVTDFVVNTLESCCHEVKSDAPTVKRLPNVQHLLTRVCGQLLAGTTLDRLQESLHPTPAVCGNPRDVAKEWIRELEPFDRGLYAGTLGWVDDKSADWCVGIRSALISGNEAHLFAGAGLVAGSDPDREYEECRWKMSLMRDAIAGEHPHNRAAG